MRNNQPITDIEHRVPSDWSLISRTDLKGKITYANQAFFEMCGYSEEELLGSPHNIVRHPDMPEIAFDDLWKTLKVGESWTGMVKNRCKNGDYYWVLANATPIIENGVTTGYTSVRTAPTRQQIDAAGKVYAKLKSGHGKGITIKRGKAVRKGPIGKVLSLKDLHITGKLMTVVALLCVSMAAVGVIGLAGIERSNAALNSVYADRAVPLGQLDIIVRLLNLNRLSITTAVLRQDPDLAKSSAKEIEINLARVSATWQAYIETSLTPEEKNLAERFGAARAAFLDKGLLPAIAALKAGNLAEAKRLELEVLPALFEPVRHSVNDLITLQLDVAKTEAVKARTSYHTMRATILALIALGSLFACGLAWYLIRSIVRPLNQAVTVANQIAAGNLTAKVEATSDDEVGQLLRALGIMKSSLGNIISGVRECAEMIGQASSEIADGNADLSQRTEEQASSLEETSSSMEQLTSTVQNTADNSSSAKQMVQTAQAVAIQGGAAMDQVVSTMYAIAASSRKITDIIAVIDSIAFQTNILALNAAVEAARAGEQGRGFAVVASEVRNLAHRSGSAAKEIKNLISDSVGKITGGSMQVTQARETIEDVVKSVKQITDIMNEISAASSEQSTGINQVTQAVMQMDQVTQQNAALVEQAAAAAESMKIQCAGLVRSVEVFKLERAATVADAKLPLLLE
jgi:PAS domain S-box-containing protein